MRGSTRSSATGSGRVGSRPPGARADRTESARGTVLMVRRPWRTRLAVATTAAILSASCGGTDGPDDASPVDAGERLDYGDHDDAFGELWLPEPSGSPAPIVVLVHGGFWRDGFLLDLMDPLIPSLLDEGYAVWNIEYRRVGAGGGYPETFQDVADAVDRLAVLAEDRSSSIDAGRVAIVGHSAGGQLAAWAAGRTSLRADEVGADPVVTPRLVVAQAGVLDLVGCAERGVGGSACIDFVGAGPDAEPALYAVTSPSEMVPFDAVVVAVHGELDSIVPIGQSVAFVERGAEVGMDVAYEPVPGADHFAHLDPTHRAWAEVITALETYL